MSFSHTCKAGEKITSSLTCNNASMNLIRTTSLYSNKEIVGSLRFVSEESKQHNNVNN